MAVILVPSAAGGNYSVRIAGDTPTPQEQANIDAYVAQMDARRAPAEAAAPPPEGGVGTALGVGVDMLQQGYGSALEGLGTATGLEGLRQYGADVATFNRDEIQRATPNLTGYEDVDSIGSALSFYGQTLAQQAPQLGVSLSAGYLGGKLGAAAGAPLGPIGSAAGAVVGGIGAGVLANIPFFYGQNRERQKEVIESTGKEAQVSEGAAFLTAIPQAALDALVDRLLIGRVINPAWIAKGGIFTRAVKGAGAGAAVEVPTEIGQAVLERYQAGLPIDDAEALSEYEQVAVAAGLVGGTLRGGTAIAEGDTRKKEKEEADRRAALELQNDIGEDSAEVLQRIQFGEEADAALGERLGLPAPPKAPPLTLTPEMRVRDEEAAEGRPPVLPLTQAMRDRDAEVSGGRQPALTLDQSMRARAAEAAGGRAPTLPLTQEMRAREAESAEGRLPPLTLDDTTRLPDDTPPTGGGTKPTAPTKPTPPFTPSFVTKSLGLPAKSGLATAAAKDPAVAGKPITDPAVQERLRFIARAPSIKPEVKAKIEQVLGVRPEAPQPAEQAAQPAALAPPKAQVDRVLQVLQKAREQQIAGKNQLVSKSGAKSLVDAGLLAPEDTTIPAIATAKVSDLLSLGPDAVRQRMTAAPGPQARKSQQTATQPISAPQPSVTAAAAADSPFGPDYTSKLNRVGAALRKRLTNLGLSDVDLVTSRTIKPEGVQDNVLIEGMMDVDQKAGKRIISLALSVFDPKLSPQQLFDAVARVMDHEVIHALRSLGLFKTAEWNSLSELAARQKYMRVKDGKVTERGYTYLQRAQQMYANDSAEVQVEEAVAEMFRDYIAGRLKIGGRPRTLMDRIKGFFRAIWGSHKETGFTDPAAVFANIRSGDLGRRERVSAPTPQDTARMSRAAAQAAPSDPDFRSWATGPKGEQAIVDASGAPVVYYTGTSKDQDFTKFKVGRHGGWFVTDPEEASGYAMQNDSMGYRFEGWGVTKTNQASRVIPAFLRAANPYRGPLPEFALAQNYKKAQSDWFDSLRAQGHDAWMPSDVPSLMVVLGDDKQVKSVFARGADGKSDMRRFSIRTDNPGGDWLKRKQARAEEDMRTADSDSFRSKGLGGSVTGYMKEPVMFPTEVLSRLPGAQDEVRGPGDPKFDSLAADVAKGGFREDQYGNSVVVGVNHLGQAYILEGNTRLAVAQRNSIPDIRAEVRYFNGGELADGPMSPDVVSGIVAGADGKPRLVGAPAGARYSMLTVPEGTRAHNLPDILLSDGDGSKARLPITQAYLPSNLAKNNAAIDVALAENPQHLRSEGGWSALMQDTLGGDYVPKAPYVAIDYASRPERIAEKLTNLTPALKDGVDRGFAHVKAIRDLYRSGTAQPDMTADLFIWGILSRGAGPVQQEGAYIDVIDSAKPFVEMAISGPLSDADIDLWKVQVSGALKEASPGRQVTMNVNAAGRLMQAMSQLAPGSDKTVLQTVHEMMSDPLVSGPEIRRWFLSNTESAGIDNKVVSFILLVGGRDDVLVMDRIQSRHLWDDGRFGGANIYDGIGPDGGGLSKIMKGPRGLLVTEALERGLRDSVATAYRMIGRPEDGSLGRFHWESWVIEGEQVVDHSTLAAVAARTPVGFSVTEGKMATFSSGSRYIRTENGSVMEYPLSNGDYAYMRPTTFKDFLSAIKSGKFTDSDGKPAKLADPIIPKNFKVTERADIPWYERPDVDRRALDDLARRFEDAQSERDVYGRDARSGAGPAATGGGSARFSRADAGRGARDGGGGRTIRGLAPLEGAPRVQGATGPDLSLVAVAEKYAKENGIDLRRQAEYVKVDPDRAARIAAAYEAMEHAPSDPKVKEAYDDLIRQTTSQYNALADAGYKFWFMDADNPGDYASSPFNAMRDLRANKSMGVFPTVGGFGTQEADISGNPLLQETGLMWPYGGPDGALVPVLANDLFRAVHDAFGHGLEGSGFRADGEENAWQAHIRLFTGPAKGAITSETRGQNSWLNFGPYGESNRDAKVEDTVFADQKTGLMPEWTWTEGLAADDAPYPDRRLSRLSVRPSISPTVGRQITARQNELMYARGSDAIARILSKTRIAKPDDAKRFTDSVLRRFQDSMLPVGRMIQELSARGLNITDAMDTYLKEWNYHGITGEKIRANTDRLYNPAIKAVEKLNVPKAKVDQLIALTNAASADGRGYVGLAMQSTDSPKLVLANAYLYAKHARERNRYIQKNIDKTNFTGSGMNDAEADTIVKWFETLDQQNKNAITELGAMVRSIIADTTKQRIEGSLVTPDVSDPYQFYVPLRGKENGDTDTEDPGQKSSMGGRGFGARRREDPKALGRYDYASDVLANVLYQNQKSIDRAERNKIGRSFLNLLRSDPSMTKDYAEILPKAPTVRKQGAQPGVMVEVRMDDINSKPEFLVVKEEGVEKFIRINDPRLLGVLNGSNGMSPGMLAPVLNAMSTVNRYLASINTSRNPDFIVTNALRDVQAAGINLNQYEMEGLTSQVLKDVIPALAGIKRAIRNKDETSQWAQVYRDFARAGGKNSTNPMNTLADQMSNIESLLTDISESGIRGQYAKVKRSFLGKGVGSLLDLIENYNDIAENGVRVATYKALLDRGMTKERAAQAARGITVNFSKSGDYRNFMNAFYLFYNASLQGSFALLNAAARSKKVQKLWIATIASGFLLDQLNSMMSPEDEDEEKVFDKMPEHVLEHNLVLMDPFGITPRGYFSIPLAYGLNAGFNTGRSISRWWRGEYSPGEATSSMWGTLLDIINPIGGAESFANFAAPTVLDPFVDLSQNEDFANKAIYKENVSFDKTPAPDSQLHWSTTSPSLIWMTQTLNDLTGGNDVRPGYVDISPDVAQFWIEFTLGGVGRFVQSLVEAPLKIGAEGFTEETWRGIPFARKLYGSVSEREDTSAYIERAREVLMAGEELKRARETGDVQWAQETISTYGDQLRLLGPIKSIESQLTKISRMMN